MKRILTCIASVVVITITWNVSAAEWLVDLPTALRQARQENKTVLLAFTGSDWCILCKRLKGEVLDKAEFQKFADANLILVEADFPQAKKLPPAQSDANKKLAAHYEIESFPTVILLDADEKVRGKTTYAPGGPKPFIAELEKMISVKKRGPSGQPASAFPSRQLPGPAAKNDYHQIALKAISGSKAKRLALINNQSFAQGETATVKVGDAKVKIFCKEIRDQSVLVQIDGKPEIELVLGKSSAPAEAALK